MTDHLLYRVEDGVAVVTLHRPQVLNALSSAMLDGFVEAMARAGADDAVRAVVLTGAGERAFSAGQDLHESAAFTAETIGPHFRRLGVLYQSVRALDKPSVAALNGVAAGFGFQAALQCDLRVGHAGVRMSQPEVAAGIPSAVGIWIIAQMVGLPRAIELSLTCRMVGAEEALSWGLLDRIVPADRVLDEAKAMALDLAAKPPLALAKSEMNLRRLTQDGYDATIEAAVRVQTEAFRSGEPQRVAAEFLARRKAKEAGR